MSGGAAESQVRDPMRAAQEYLLNRPWWELVLRGLFIMIFGIIAIAWPETSLWALILVFGVFIFVEGLFQMIAAFSVKKEDPNWSLMFISGLFSFIIGLLAISWPGVTAVVLLWLIGAWAIVTGISQIAYSGQANADDGARRGLMVVGGLIAIMFGFMAFLWPGATAITIILIVGFFAIFYGIQLMVVGFMSRGR
ncbi:MAG: hypothetical protein GQ558_03535 [Thermoplasmata archaeon]|nr:hypothetical protein [Thermoplasmata archaeon]